MINRATVQGLRIIVLSAIAAAATPHEVDEVTVMGRTTDLIGEALSASEGLVGQADIAVRPLLRPGEVMELVPGLVATQHSGSGKANQYFLRGFNLDHGTDFATVIDYMPVNMRTHGHGQGYTDLSFLIPEIIDHLAYRKGPYYAEVGDFSGAGSAHITTVGTLPQGTVQLTGGRDHYWRMLTANSVPLVGGDFLYALEAQRYDGPWTDIEEDARKYNALLKYSRALGDGNLSVTFMGYDNDWNSADQIPRRAVNSGLIDALGSIDTSLGGQSSRYSLSAAWESKVWTVALYAIDYDLNLWSNFTYFLDDPTDGDQFEQVDRRRLYGGTVRHTTDFTLADRSMANTFGLDTRLDVIDEVGLYKTVLRAARLLGAVRSDKADELSIGLYWQNQIHWTPKLRSILGARYDYYDFDVTPRVAVNVNGVDITANSGHRDDALFSLKGSLAYAFDEHWEMYAGLGQGFHSNDARGTVTRVDPTDGAAIDPVDPLVRSLGSELGLRTHHAQRLNAALSLWTLRLDSELLFVGDAGNTEPSRESERRGVELTAYYRLDEAWTVDLEYSWTDAQFSEPDPADPTLGNHIPGAAKDVLQAGIGLQRPDGLFGSLRLRYFGPRPLDENNNARSDGSTVANLLVGQRWKTFTLKGEVLNLLDSTDHDIDYFYASRLPGETLEGVDDVHYHVMEPRTFRITLSANF